MHAMVRVSKDGVYGSDSFNVCQSMGSYNSVNDVDVEVDACQGTASLQSGMVMYSSVCVCVCMRACVRAHV